MSLQELLDERAITHVLYRYCRGIDRRQYDLVRSCYHPDATDDHGLYKGDVDGFIAYIERELPRFQGTMHFIGNVLVELAGDVAHTESYTVAHHRLAASRDGSKPERDYLVGLRYVDRFERRAGRWAIAARTCVMDWGRMEEVPSATPAFDPAYVMGRPDDGDAVFTLREPVSGQA